MVKCDHVRDTPIVAKRGPGGRSHRLCVQDDPKSMFCHVLRICSTKPAAHHISASNIFHPLPMDTFALQLGNQSDLDIRGIETHGLKHFETKIELRYAIW